MELRQLRYFTAVARHGHFRSAALALHLTQPTLSEQIQLLEQELGVRLFDRGHQMVQLTPAGVALLPHAETVLHEIERTRATMRNLARHDAQRVVMGTVTTLTPPPLATALARFHDRFPSVDIVLREGDQDHLLASLRSAEIDVIVAPFAGVGPDLLPDDLIAEVSLIEELVAVVGPNHPLACQKKVQFEALREQSLVLSGEGSVVRHAVMSEARKAGFELQIALECTSFGTARQMAARGLGLSIVPLPLAKSPQLPQVHVVEFGPPPLMLQMALVSVAGRQYSQAASTLIDFMRKQLDFGQGRRSLAWH